MAQVFRNKRVGGVGDDAVKAKTGKKWDEWFKILDKAGARMMDHDQIALLVRRQLGLPPWWSRLLTVGDEQARGLRRMHQRGLRYQVYRQKTLAAPLAAVWSAWHDQNTLAHWLPGVAFELRTFTQDKVLHLTWPDGTWVAVRFWARGDRTRLVVAHKKLLSSRDVLRLQDYWSAALERLQSAVAG